MANYHFNPKKNEVDSKKYGKNISNTLNSFSKNKLKITAGVLLFLFFIVAGDDITGAFIYNNADYDALSKNPDFPQLSKQEANLKLYLCEDDKSILSSALSISKTDISDLQNTYNICNTEKEQINANLQLSNEKYRDYENNYNSCQSETNTLQSNLDSCNSDKSVKDSHLTTCNNLLREKDIKYSDYESEREEIIQNYANSVCCTLKQISNPSLKYYNLENNKIVCSETGGKTFDC